MNLMILIERTDDTSAGSLRADEQQNWTNQEKTLKVYVLVPLKEESQTLCAGGRVIFVRGFVR